VSSLRHSYGEQVVVELVRDILDAVRLFLFWGKQRIHFLIWSPVELSISYLLKILAIGIGQLLKARSLQFTTKYIHYSNHTVTYFELH
jgi:hypothetical protein